MRLEMPKYGRRRAADAQRHVHEAACTEGALEATRCERRRERGMLEGMRLEGMRLRLRRVKLELTPEVEVETAALETALG